MHENERNTCRFIVGNLTIRDNLQYLDVFGTTLLK
jgi:hypothetical protein